MDELNEVEMNFEDMLKGYSEPEVGGMATVQIVNINENGVLVHMGTKYEGIIPVAEFGHGGIPKDLAPGKEIPVVLLPEIRGGHRVVSYVQARQKMVWKDIVAAHRSSSPVRAVIVKKIKGGYIVDIGIDAFLPASQLVAEKTDGGDSKDVPGRVINVFVTEINDRKKDAVVSHRKWVESEKKIIADKVITDLKPGDVIEGKVTGVTDFGAFVDVGGIDGLVHISDLSWQRVEKTGDVVKIGDTVKAKVLKLDKQTNKISLGIKHLKPHPWDKVEEKYPAGSIVRGKVNSITGFGAFIELEPGVEGLLHVSELSWDGKTDDIKNVLHVEEEVDVKVVDVSRSNERISLSIKRLLLNPWEKFRNDYPAGTKVRGCVTRLAPFGAFVSLPGDKEGLIHIQDMSWMKKINHPKEVLGVGDEIEAVVTEINPEEEKAVLSIKHLTEDPYEKFGAGKIVKGNVVKIVDFGVYVKLGEGVDAFIHKSEMSREKGKHPAELFNIDQEVEAKVIRSDRDTRKIDISIKRMENDRERELIEKYSVVPKAQLSDILEEE